MLSLSLTIKILSILAKSLLEIELFRSTLFDMKTIVWLKNLSMVACLVYSFLDKKIKEICKRCQKRTILNLQSLK